MFVIASTTNNDVRKENANFMREGRIQLLHFTIKEHTQRWNNSNRVLAIVSHLEQTQSTKECALCGGSSRSRVRLAFVMNV